MTQDALVLTFSEAIAHYEGFYEKAWMFGAKSVWPTPARRNNNPGNIRTWGNNPTVGGFVKFPTIAAGFAALHKQVDKNIFDRQLSTYEFFAGQRDSDGNVIPGGYFGYAPGADNNHPTTYARYVMQFLLDRGFDIRSIQQPVFELAG